MSTTSTTLTGILREANGKFSLLRLCVLLIVAEILFEHVYSLLRVGAPMAWDYQGMLALVGALGAKVVQRRMEGP